MNRPAVNTLLLATVLLAAAPHGCTAAPGPPGRPWLDPTLPIPQRVKLLMAQMTLEEKVGCRPAHCPSPSFMSPRAMPPRMRTHHHPLHPTRDPQAAQLLHTSIGIELNSTGVIAAIKAGGSKRQPTCVTLLLLGPGARAARF